MRKQPRIDAQVAEAAKLYATGLSVAAVGGALNLSPSTIWRTLTPRDVPMRALTRRSSEQRS